MTNEFLIFYSVRGFKEARLCNQLVFFKWREIECKSTINDSNLLMGKMPSDHPTIHPIMCSQSCFHLLAVTPIYADNMILDVFQCGFEPISSKGFHTENF